MMLTARLNREISRFGSLPVLVGEKELYGAPCGDASCVHVHGTPCHRYDAPEGKAVSQVKESSSISTKTKPLFALALLMLSEG